MSRYVWMIGLAGFIAACDGDKDSDTADAGPGGDSDTEDTSPPDDTDEPDTDTDVPVEDAQVRILHLGVGVANVDVFVDDAETAAASDIAFKGGTDYVPLAPAMYNFDVSATGDTAADALLTLDATLEEGKSYAAVAIGFGPGDGGTPAASLVAFEEDPDELGGNTRLHIVHAAAGVGEVDIYNNADLSTPLAENVAYGADTTLPDLTPGALTVGIDTDDDGTPDLTFDVPDLGEAYVSVYAVNSAGSADDADVSLVAHIAGTAAPTEIAAN